MRSIAQQLASVIAIAALANPLPAYAQPSGGSVVRGSATISAPNPISTLIKQSTNSAIINWQSFSVANGGSVVFDQPNAAAITLNRVLGGGTSTIDGSLQANGQVWIINANGILFGKNSQTNVGGLLATTSDISDNDFAAGNYNFGTPSSNASASVDNAGTIHVANGGSAVLSGPHVSNSGLIQADAGQIVLGGANAFTVDFDGDNLLRYAITTPVANTPTDASGNAQKALVENSGTLSSAGGRIVMTARAAANVADNVVNNTGMISATSVAVKNGEVILDAGDGTVSTSGSIDATGSAAGQSGGNVTLAGNSVAVADGATIDASGDAGGGTVSVGGGLHGGGSYAPARTTIVGTAEIHADANSNGNGGTVSIWSSGQTQFSGTITARGGVISGSGGTVETSGASLGIASAAAVDTSAPFGKQGDWLLDPLNLNIAAAGSTLVGGLISYGSATSTVSASSINTALVHGNVTLQAVDDISINAVIDGAGFGHTLTFDAGRSIFVNAAVNMALGGGTVVLSADNPAANRSDPGAAMISGAGMISADFVNIFLPSNGLDGSSVGTAASPLSIGHAKISIQTAGANAFVQTGGDLNASMILGNVDVGAGHLQATAVGNLQIASGATISSSASGDAVVLSAGQNFVNSAGSGAISLTGGGRFIVYSAAPGSDTFGGLNSGNTAVWHAIFPTAVSQSGNRYVFASQPTLTFTTTNLVKTYGTDASAAVQADYSITGYDHGIAGVYLADNSASTFTGTPTVSSTGSSAGASVAGGPYAITVTQGSSTAISGYRLVFAGGGSLTIGQASLLITADNQSMTYGGAMPTLTASYSGFVNGDTAANLTTAPTVVSGTAATANAGTYAGTLTASGAVDANYAISYAAGTLTIGKAALLITANPLSKIYGQADPALTYTASGLVNGDTSAVFTGSLTRAAGENVGGYAISQGSLAANSNYTIAFSGNTLNITPATLSISANTETKVYGQGDPALSYVATGFQFSDTSATVLTGSLTRAAGENVGGYAIGQGTLAANSNYTIAFTGNTLHITPATLTVAANPLSKVYGTTDPALTYTATGFQFTDNSATVLSGSLTRAAGENVGNYAISQGSLVANANYTIAFSGANFAITQALLTITANPLSKIYGQADPTLTYTASGFENGDTVSILSGSLTRAAGENVGGYAILQGTLGTSANYTIAFTGSTLSITPAQLTVTANPLSKIYGQADPALTYIATGFQFSDSSATVLTGSLTRAAGENVGGYAISQGTLASNSNYTIAFTGSTLNITPAQLTISANGQSKVYGQVDPTLSYTVSGLQFTDTGATVLSGSLTRAAGENVGGYAISQGSLAANSNYTIAFSGNTLNITPATLSISANTETKVYGQGDPALSYVATGFQFSDTSATVLTGSLTRAAGENVGGYAIGQGTLAANSNYTIAFTGNTLHITPATLTVAANPLSKVYGTTDPALTYTATGFQFTDNSATVLSGSLTRAAGENVGNYAISQGSLVANANYTIAFSGANFAITQALLTITANPLSKIYGQADPTLTYTASGFENGDTVSILSGSLTRAAGENVGGYAILQGTLGTSANYTIAFTGSTLSITPAQLTVTANPLSKIYGQADPALTYIATGFQFSDNSATVLTGSLTRAAGQNVGGYAISQGTLASNSNYTIAFSGSTLNITPAQLTISANGQSKVYGQSDPTLTYTASGLVNGDTSAVFTGSLTRAAGENVGGYAIGPGSLAANSNYTIAFSGNTLNITPATLTYVATSANRTYGSANPTFAGSVSGFVNGDTLSSATTGSATFTSTATATSNVGTYAIDGSGLTATSGNYVFAQAAANATALTINPATLTYVATAGSIESGTPIPTLTGTVTGFVNGETQATATTGTLIFTTLATPSSPVGVYAINGSGLSANNGNYVFAQDPGNASALTIATNTTLSLPPEFNNVVTVGVQNNNGDPNTPGIPPTSPGDDSNGGLYTVVGHTPKGADQPGANTVLVNGPIAQLVADTVVGTGFSEVPTSADLASSSLGTHFISSYHDNFSSWGNDAFWH